VNAQRSWIYQPNLAANRAKEVAHLRDEIVFFFVKRDFDGNRLVPLIFGDLEGR
jgi:hypothetical protein